MMHLRSSFIAFLFVAVFICEADLNTKDKSRILTITAKSYINELYVDDIKVDNLINADRWNMSDDVNLSPDNRLIAILVTDASFSCGGILASVTGDYLVTDASWKCSAQAAPGWYAIGFDDSGWSDAYVIGKNGEVTTPSECNILTEIPSISSNASWIWTPSIANAPVYDTTIFCRGYLPLCDQSPCQSGGTCNRNDPQICTCPPYYSGTYCERSNPMNAAALSGYTVTMNCKRLSTNVTWWFSTAGSGNSLVIVSDCKVLPEFTGQYTLDTSDGACNLVMLNAQLSHAGTYSCQETSTADERTSAELTILYDFQQCLSSPNPVLYGQNVTITCDLSYSGNWAPTIRWVDYYGQAVTNDTTVTTSSNVNSYIQIPAFFPSVPSFTSLSYFSELKLPNITGDIRANNTPSNIYAAVTQEVDVVCPSGFTRTSQYHCYQLISENLNWNNSMIRCQQLYPGAYLVVISDASEQTDIQNYLAPFGSISVWTSGFATNGCWDFTWQPLPGYSLPMTYTNWIPGAPDCFNGYQPSVELWGAYLQWNDESPVYTNYCLCEYELSPK